MRYQWIWSKIPRGGRLHYVLGPRRAVVMMATVLIVLVTQIKGLHAPGVSRPLFHFRIWLGQVNLES